MSGGGFFGYIMNGAVFSGLWWVLGACIDRIGIAFNRSIEIMPTFQDAVNGFSTMQIIWGSLLAIMWLVLSINYFIVENTNIPQEV